MIQKYALVCFAFFAFIASGFGQTETIIINLASTGGSANIGNNNYNTGAERTWTQDLINFGGKAITAAPAGANFGSIQSQANNGLIYNTTPLPGRLVSVVVTSWTGSTNRASTLYGGETTRLVNTTAANYNIDASGTSLGALTPGNWTTGGATNYTYFALKRGANAAYWSQIEITYEVNSTYNVTYDGNGNTGGTVPTDATAYNSGDPVTVSDSGTLTRTGFNFAGWNTAADGSGDSYVANDTFNITANTTLYAVWTAITDTVDYCNLQNPQNGTVEAGEPFNIQARVYEAGLTDIPFGPAPALGIQAWIGYSTTNATNVGDFTSGWTWVPATFLAETNGDNNDEYQVNLGEEILTPGTYYYVSRFSLNSGPFTYGGYNVGGGGFWNGSSNVSGVLTVTPAILDFYNLQFPQNGTIDLGDGFDVFAQAYEAGVTEAAGVGNDIVAWIGYSTTNATSLADFNSPSWNWVLAPYVGQAGPFPFNNDEFMLDLGSEITTAGTYYYVSRFQYNSGDFLYGGFDTGGGNGAWDGVQDVSGVLVINGPTECLNESFTSATFPPSNWLATNVTRSTAAADYNSGPAAATFGSNNGTLTTDELAFPTSLRFYLGRSSNTTAKTLNINISTDSQTGPFTTIAVFNHGNVPASSYNEYLVDLSAYSTAPNVWIQFEKVSSTTSPWRFDDVIVECGPFISSPELQLVDTLGADQNCGYTINFGSQALTTDTDITFDIENIGSADLDITSLALSGTNAGDFSIVLPATPFTVTSGNIQTVTVRFTPSANGTRTATLTINNTDANEGACTVLLTGVGFTPAPEINVEGNVGAFPDITNGDVTPSFLDNTEFASQFIGSSQTKSFWVNNEGTSDLSISSITLGGANPGDFTLDVLPNFTITPGSIRTELLEITFSPLAAGERNATVIIVNNDGDETNFVFNIRGTGSCGFFKHCAIFWS
jgi:uncharacterized repeat protein (TIGR02543 family)